MEKILSIVIPTIGRKEFLPIVLDAFLDQVCRNKDDIEFYVSDNASTDGTALFVDEFVKKYPFFKVEHFSDRVEAHFSYSRSVSLACGEYVLLWGDDDIPMPYMVDILLSALKKNSNNNISVYHYNVLVGRDNGDCVLRSLRTENTNYRPESERIMPINEFMLEFPLSPGFLSSFVFRKKMWEDGLKYYSPVYAGYTHLLMVYSTAKNSSCVYINYPLCIQRVPYKRDWIGKWPKYKLIEVPQLMKYFEDSGVCSGIYEKWNKTENKSLIKHLYTLFIASAYKKQYIPLIKEINRFQKSNFRKISTYFFLLLIPSFIYPTFRKLIFK